MTRFFVSQKIIISQATTRSRAAGNYLIKISTVTSGGTWTGDGVNSVGLFDPGKANIGQNFIIYSLTIDGCTDVKTIMIFVTGKSALGFPNVFSPNGDEWNNEFKADTAEGIADFHIVIYNRWGKKIYEWDDVKDSWDGTTYNGNKAPDGVYYYVVSAKGEDDVLYDLSGYVTLIGRE